MVSDLDPARSFPDSVTSEHQATKQPALMNLPMEVIEEIARHTGNSLCYLALAHPRFAIFHRLRRDRIEINHTCEDMRRSVALNSQNVRALILMDCHSESSLILSLILQCPLLTELNTLNSGLTDSDLVQGINFLSKLETLTCSFPEGSDNGREAPFRDKHSIKSIYVEHGPKAFVFLLKLINSCVNVERLHLVGLPYAYVDGCTRHWHSDTIVRLQDGSVDPSISRERWQTLQTVILVKLGSVNAKWERGHIRSVFQNRTVSLDVDVEQLFRKKEIVYDRGTFNVEAPTQSIADEPSLLSRMYRVGPEDPVWHYGLPPQPKLEDSRAWSTPGSSPKSIASLTTLVELDLSECHARNGSHIWFQLLQSSTGLKSLTVPLCLLTAGSCDKHGNEVFLFVEALERLKLKKLCCSSRCCRRRCHHGRLLPNLTGLTHLEELTLIGAPIDAEFLSRIAIRSLSCLRIIKRWTVLNLDLSKLEGFFEACKELRYLKLDWDNLPLHEELLWRRLGGANLKQLCITSWSWKPVDLSMIRRNLPEICQSLDVLHVHAYGLHSAEQFSSFLIAEIAEINRKREHSPLQTILPGSRSHNVRRRCQVVPNFPGRALCSLEIKSRLKLVGWDI